MHVPEISERYGLLMEAYLRGCSTIYRAELHKQDEIIKQLTDVAVKIKEIKNKEERLEAVRFQLRYLRDTKIFYLFFRQIDFPSRFQLPLFTNVECKGLIIEKCKVMTSKKLPLWLVFENADRNGANITVIFKSGDDLRQDVLTLVIFSNALWVLIFNSK
jgi:phosphatidylinositol kinase/protein kinase (PI-3  family)